MNFSKSFKGISLALTATLLWSANLVIARGLSDMIPPVTLAFYRWLIAFVVLLPLTFRSFVKQWKVIKANLTFFVFAALLGVTFFNTLIYVAGKTTTATNLSLIAITAPVFITILSRIFYKEKFPFKSTIGIAVAFLGIVYLICKGDLSVLVSLKFKQGDILMLIAAICFASYSVLMRNKPKEVDMAVLLLVTIFIGLIFLAPVFIVEKMNTGVINYTPTLIGALLYAGIINSIVAFYFWNNAILTIGSQLAGIIYYSLPLFSSTLAIFILKEEIRMFHILSLLAILTGIYTASYFKLKNRKE